MSLGTTMWSSSCCDGHFLVKVSESFEASISSPDDITTSWGQVHLIVLKYNPKMTISTSTSTILIGDMYLSISTKVFKYHTQVHKFVYHYYSL